MNLFNPEYNKKRNLFDQGVTMIRNKNNNFFLNAKNEKSIYDLTDIGSYYSIYETGGEPSIIFREGSGLPDRIKGDVQELFDRVWGVAPTIG
jgi:hypothetical protein